MSGITVDLVHCPAADTYRSEDGLDILPAAFVAGILDEYPERVAMTVSTAPLQGGVEILATDLGWQEIMLRPDAFALRCLLSPEHARSLDFQLWIHARHGMCRAFVALLQDVARAADNAWLELDPV